MSIDAWIASVQEEVEQSPEFRVLRDMISGWLLSPDRGPLDTRPDWWTTARQRITELGNPERIAHEAGRRYQAALNDWRAQ